MKFLSKFPSSAVLLHFRTPPLLHFHIVIDDSLWKNAAESFTVALTLTLGGYESAIAPVLQTPHPTPWRISGCAPALRYFCFCKILDLKCLKVFWIHLCLDNCSVIYTVTLILNSAASHVQNSGIPIQHTVFMSNHIIFSFIKAYEYWDIKGIFSTLCNPPRPGAMSRYWHGGFFKTLWNNGLAYSEPCSRARIIQPYSGNSELLQWCLHMHAETWHTWNPGNIQNSSIIVFWRIAYSKPCYIHENSWIFRIVRFK